jgi:hypothetical protein
MTSEVLRPGASSPTSGSGACRTCHDSVSRAGRNLEAVDVDLGRETAGELQVGRELLPAQRRHLRVTFDIRPARGPDPDRVRLRTIAPRQPGTHGAHERGVEHPHLAVSADVNQPEQPLEKRRSRPALLGDQRELVILHPPPVRMDPVDQCGIHRLRSPRAVVVAQAREQHGRQALWVVHDLPVEAGVGLDVQADPVPAQPVLG